MATTIERERDRSDGAAGWAIAVILALAIVVVAAIIWARYYNATPGIPNTGGTNINVTTPAPSTGGTY
ncbi:MAG: hypothetical protein KGI70_00780 [Patescibacteria group bacterium]|nr:hypothetical protein [Patescibacteria group bacterium]